VPPDIPQVHLRQHKVVKVADGDVLVSHEANKVLPGQVDIKRLLNAMRDVDQIQSHSGRSESLRKVQRVRCHLGNQISQPSHSTMVNSLLPRKVGQSLLHAPAAILASMESRKPLQFGLGSLLWLVLLVAVLIGWHQDRTQLRRELQQQSHEVQAIRHQAAAEKARSDAMLRRYIAAESELKRFKEEYRIYEEVKQDLSRTELRLRRETESGLILQDR
jgi:hypothetical protein